MDSKSAFLHDELSKEIYMEKTIGFVTYSLQVCRLQKSLYGLKKAPQAWFEKIDLFVVNMVFKYCEFDHSIYVLQVKGYNLIVVVYDDDLVLTGNNLDLIFRFKSQLADTFEMTNIGILHFFLGLHVLPLSDGLFIYQSKYVLDLLKHLEMGECEACANPFQLGVTFT